MTKEVHESTLAALRSSINKESALATYLKSFMAKNPDNLIVRETGICLLNNEKN